ncbi:hypothetical protein BDQ17DRAFT_482783 [Cyathus striatus]|nr:hypothetical protein BDQ17DRAFT_482783 [Cyathus striatus]
MQEETLRPATYNERRHSKKIMPSQLRSTKRSNGSIYQKKIKNFGSCSEPTFQPYQAADFTVRPSTPPAMRPKIDNHADCNTFW